MITPLPGAHALKPGSAIRPFFGIDPQIVDADGALQTGNPAEGNLCIAKSWPGQMRTVWGDHERFFQTYFATYPGYYLSGDGRSEENTSELQSLMRISYAVLCLKKKKRSIIINITKLKPHLQHDTIPTKYYRTNY